jgi:fumarate hydratase, class II
VLAHWERRVQIMNDADDAAPKILDLPIGLDVTGTRREFDSLGNVDVPADRYWGAQTQRSLEHFNIGNDRMPKEVYHAYGYVKKAAAVVNTQAGRLPEGPAHRARLRRGDQRSAG